MTTHQTRTTSNSVVICRVPGASTRQAASSLAHLSCTSRSAPQHHGYP